MSSQHDGTVFTFAKVVSYNILHGKYVKPEYFPTRSARDLNGTIRINKLMSQIRDMCPDILCLQEVGQAEHLCIKLFLETIGMASGPLAIKGKEPEGCFVAYRTQIFEEDNNYQISAPSLSPKGVASVMELRLRGAHGNPFRISVASLHLPGDPREPNVQLEDLRTIMGRINSTTEPSNPILLCGDFNAVPGSGTYRFLTEGTLPAGYKDTPSLPGGGADPSVEYTRESLWWYGPIFVSACRRPSLHSDEPYPTILTHAHCKTIDYIFFSGNRRADVMHTIRYGGPDAEHMPNAIWPSDHFPIEANLRFTVPIPVDE